MYIASRPDYFQKRALGESIEGLSPCGDGCCGSTGMFKLRIPIFRGPRPADVCITPFVAARRAVQIPSPVQAATDCDSYLLTIINPSHIFRLLAK